MKTNKISILAFTILFCFIATGSAVSQSRKIKRSLVAFWDFKEPPGSPRKSKSFKSDVSYNLIEANGAVETLNEGPAMNSAVRIEQGNWLFIPRDSIGELNIYGADFTVGANHVQGKMTNQFIGAITGLSVFNRALSEKDIRWIYSYGIDID